jgi:hypothetical protein
MRRLVGLSMEKQHYWQSCYSCGWESFWVGTDMFFWVREFYNIKSLNGGSMNWTISYSLPPYIYPYQLIIKKSSFLMPPNPTTPLKLLLLCLLCLSTLQFDQINHLK